MRDFTESIIASRPQLAHLCLYTEWAIKKIRPSIQETRQCGVGMWMLEYPFSGEYTSEDKADAEDGLEISFLPMKGTFMKITLGRDDIHSQCPRPIVRHPQTDQR
jgi:hypothetical protein